MVKIMTRGPGVLRISTHSQTLNVRLMLVCLGESGVSILGCQAGRFW